MYCNNPGCPSAPTVCTMGDEALPPARQRPSSIYCKNVSLAVDSAGWLSCPPPALHVSYIGSVCSEVRSFQHCVRQWLGVEAGARTVAERNGTSSTRPSHGVRLLKKLCDNANHIYQSGFSESGLLGLTAPSTVVPTPKVQE